MSDLNASLVLFIFKLAQASTISGKLYGSYICLKAPRNLIKLDGRENDCWTIRYLRTLKSNN